MFVFLEMCSETAAYGQRIASGNLEPGNGFLCLVFERRTCSLLEIQPQDE